MGRGSCQACFYPQILLRNLIEEAALFDKGDVTLPAFVSSGTNANSLLAANRISTFLCPSFAEVRSRSTIDLPSPGSTQNAHTTHYVGNAGPIGTNPVTNAAYRKLNSTPTVGDMACEGVLPFLPSVVTSYPAKPASVRLKDITDGTSNTLMVYELAWQEMAPSLRSWMRGGRFQWENVTARNIANQIRSWNNASGTNFMDISMGSQHPGGCTVTFADASTRFLSNNTDLNTVLLPLASRAGTEQGRIP